MTIRNRLAIRFTGLVSAILLLTFVSVYAFCWYFVSSDFYRRLDRKANTLGDMLIRHRLDAKLIRQLGKIRKDQLPNQKYKVYDGRDSIIYETNDAVSLDVSPDLISSIRQQKRKDFRQGIYYVSGTRFITAGPPGQSGLYVVLASAENTYGDAFLRQLFWALSGLFFLSVGITAFSGWFFSGDALQPMQRMNQKLNAIFPDNRDERLPVKQDDDEISRLSSTINRLLDRVAESFRLQRMFVANVSHELKNPLTQISSQLEVSLLNQRNPEAYRQTIRSVLDDVTTLSALTHELLQLSQVNLDNAARLLTDTVRIDEIVWDIRDEINAVNPRYQVLVDLGELPDDPDQLIVRGNKTLLCTAIKNVTENACKFSPDGQARVQVDFGQKVLQISILNDGPAIPGDDLPYIFEPFYRGSQTAEVRGYGIGLSLVERIVGLHGGHVSVSSSPGQLTLFRLEIPRRPYF
jgi:signal transduction histidine kinase